MKRPFTTLLILSGFLAASCNRGATRAASSDRPTAPNKDEIVLTQDQQAIGMIETQPVALSDAPELLRVAGRISLADERAWRVGVRTVGVISSIQAALGEYVHKDDVLAYYHADELREARAQYRTAISELSRLESAAALAQRNFDRVQTLLNLKAASLQQLDQTRQDLLSAQAAVKNGQIEAQRNYEHLEDDLRVDAEPAPGDETADEVPIIAPAGGYIIEKNVTPGQTVELSTTAFVIGDLSQVWMLASVRQEDLGRLRVGQSASVTLPGVPGQNFPGKLTNLGQQFDEATRVMQVRIVLNNPANRLKPEMLATAEIPVGRQEPQLLVPSDALQQVNDQDVVFVRTAPDRFAIRAVRAGETAGGRTPILEGLRSGEQVVVRGSFVLKSQLLKSTVENE